MLAQIYQEDKTSRLAPASLYRPVNELIFIDLVARTIAVYLCQPW